MLIELISSSAAPRLPRRSSQVTSQGKIMMDRIDRNTRTTVDGKESGACQRKIEDGEITCRCENGMVGVVASTDRHKCSPVVSP